MTFTPYLSQTLAWYTMLLGPPGKNGSQDWTGFSDSKFDQLVQTASQQFNPNTAAPYYSQADTLLWDDMVSLPLFAEPTALVWSRTIGGVNATPRSDEPPVVRAAVGRPVAGVDEQHDAVAAGAVGGRRPFGWGLKRADAHALRSADAAFQLSSPSEWRNRQTRQLEGLVPARAWGFKSPLRHALLHTRLPAATRSTTSRWSGRR